MLKCSVGPQGTHQAGKKRCDKFLIHTFTDQGSSPIWDPEWSVFDGFSWALSGSMGYNPLYSCHTLVDKAQERIGRTEWHDNRITPITHLAPTVHWTQIRTVFRTSSQPTLFRNHISVAQIYIYFFLSWNLEKFENKNCLGMKKKYGSLWDFW